MIKKVFMNNLSMQFEVDEIAYAILSRIQGKVSDELYNQMYDYLQGLDVELQRFLAEDILEEVISGYENYTGIDHVDEKLRIFYFLIDKELGRI